MRAGAVGLKTKIVCTLGPASREPGTLADMVKAGMDVARVNTGHCEPDQVVEDAKVLQEVGGSLGKRIGLMLDLQGPRLRVGPIKGGSAELRPGADFTITTEETVGDSGRVSVSYAGLTGDLGQGDTVLMDDGLIRLKVRKISGKDIHCEVIEGGVLRQGKGMNFPGATLGLPAFTERDRRYLEVGLKVGVDWVSQSFVRDADDVRMLREAIDGLGRRTPIMAKVEKGEAVKNIDSILKVVDGVMVARGDLGVEMSAEEVPLVQKELIDKALRAARPVVTATQMLESMVENPRPTRAEASDVANAILDGTDAVMLSAETSIGADPARVVETMARIAARAEQAIDYAHILEERGRWTQRRAADAIGYAACRIAADLKAKAVVTITRSGYTAKLVARYRPSVQVLAVSPDQEVVDSMSIVWGVRGLAVPLSDDLRQTIRDAVGACVDGGFVKKGDLVVVTGGFLDEKAGTTNMIHIHTVG